MREENNLKPSDLKLHINRSIDLPIAVQAELLGISRASIYYQPKEVNQEELDLMNKIDAIYTECPFYGSRKIAKELTKQLKFDVNRKRVQRLMRVMGIEAVYPKPNLSLNNTPHPIYPYLLKGLSITHPNQVWGADITYIRMEKGFLYLVAFMDWFSRYVVTWRLSNTLEADFCLEAAEEALIPAIPEIVNFDQGVQFTSLDNLKLWEERAVKISMDSRGRAFDNIFNERLWRSLKYEEVYLKSYSSSYEARESIGKYFDFYNFKRLHESLGYLTPSEVYFRSNNLNLKKKGGENVLEIVNLLS